MGRGAGVGLALLNELQHDAGLKGNHRFDYVKAHLLELDGQKYDAIECYRSAALKTASMPERNYLLAKATRLTVLRGEAQPE